MDYTLAHVRLGYSEVDITPKVSMECVGFDRQDNMSRGILDKLIAQILIFDNQVQKFCIVAIDSLGFTVELTNQLRKIISDDLHVTREQVMVCFSHTHSAPNAAVEKSYFNFVCTQTSDAVNRANNTLIPIKAAWGNVEADIGINRRNKDGILNRRIGILKIIDADTNKLKLMLLRVTAHANVLSSDNYLISSDFFGTTRKLLENEYSCKVIITQGSSGNVRPKYQHSDAVFMEENPNEAAAMQNNPDTAKKRFNESMLALNKMATAIRNAVNSIIKDLIPQPVYRVCMFSDTKTFSADVPSMDKARLIADEAMRKEGIDGTNWLNEVKRLHDVKIQQQNTKVEIQYFILNDGCLCGVANEVMCEIALTISQKAHSQFLYFGGYTNGCEGYLPTEEEYKKGGYEVLWSYLVYYQYHNRVMPLNSNSANNLAESVANKWIQINNKIETSILI